MMFIPGFFTVPQNHVAIKERFGQYREVLGPGLHFVNPFLDSLKDFSTWEGTAVKCSRLGSCYLLEQSEQQLETNFRTCHTKDKVPIQATSVIYFRIADPVKAAYVVDILPLTLQETCSHVMRSAIGSYDFDDLFSKRTEISKKVTSELMGKTQAWGISLSEVNIGQLQYDEEINKALQTKRIAEATKATKMIEAETAAIGSLKEAETRLKISETEAQIKENERQTLSNLASTVGKAGAVQLATATSFKELAGNSKLVVLPYDFKGVLKMAP